MKLQRITVEGYQKLTSVDITVHAPILLIAGRNEAGKTSLSDAIRHAYLDEPGRVKTQKQFGDLVNDSVKKGYVSTEWLRSGVVCSASLVIPAGTRTSDIEVTSVHRCLMDFRRFTALNDADKRGLLFGLSKTRVSGSVIRDKLLEAEANASKVESIASILLGGFAAAEKEAKAKASEARGSWKATAGEVYGSVKAAAWQAEQPEWSQTAIDEAEGLVSMANDLVAEANVDLGALQEQQSRAAADATRHANLTEKAVPFDRITAKLATDEAELATWEEKVAQTREKATGDSKVDSLACPHCAGLVVLEKGKLAQYTPPAKLADPEAAANLIEYERALTLVQSSVANDKRDLTAASNAQQALAVMAAHPSPAVDAASIQAASKRVTDLQAKLAEARRSYDAETAKKTTAVSAKTKTTEAAGYHADVVEWSVIADLLAPEGIQSKLLKDALTPIRNRLQATAMATGWPQVGVDDDMTIRIGGRPYGLNSQSAKWRADAALTEAISFLSGERFFMLDEIDVLDSENRMAFLKWMHSLATSKEIGTALVSGTFKEAPNCPPTFQVEWIQDGVVRGALQAAA